MIHLLKTTPVFAIALCIAGAAAPAQAAEFPFLTEITLDTQDLYFGASMELVDVDNDGDEDLVLQSEELSWFENDGGLSEATQQVAIGPGRRADKFRIADLDGDADPDILAASEGLVWYENKSGGQIWTAHEIGGDPSDFGIDVEAGDADGDGDLDVFYVRDDELLVYLNDAGEFSEPLPIEVPATAFDWLEGGDFDGDGAYDLLVGEGGTTEISYMRNEGSGLQWSTTAVVAPYMIHHLADADRDGDGDLDVLLGTGTHAAVLENIDGEFAVQTVLESEVEILEFTMTMGDPDADGTDDLVIANSDGDTIPGVHWFDGEGVQTTIDSQFGSADDVAVGDVDCDGDDDVIVLGNPEVNVGSTEVKIYINETNPEGAAACMDGGGESGDDGDSADDGSTGSDPDGGTDESGPSSTAGDDSASSGADDGATSGGSAGQDDGSGGCSVAGAGAPLIPSVLLMLGLAPGLLRRRD